MPLKTNAICWVCHITVSDCIWSVIINVSFYCLKYYFWSHSFSPIFFAPFTLFFHFSTFAAVISCVCVCVILIWPISPPRLHSPKWKRINQKLKWQTIENETKKWALCVCIVCALMLNQKIHVDIFKPDAFDCVIMQRNLVKRDFASKIATSVCCRTVVACTKIDDRNTTAWFGFIWSHHRTWITINVSMLLALDVCLLLPHFLLLLLLLLCHFCYRIMYNRWINDATVDVVINHWLIIFASAKYSAHIVRCAYVCVIFIYFLFFSVSLYLRVDGRFFGIKWFACTFDIWNGLSTGFHGYCIL